MKTQRREERREEIVRSPRANWTIAVQIAGPGAIPLPQIRPEISNFQFSPVSQVRVSYQVLGKIAKAKISGSHLGPLGGDRRGASLSTENCWQKRFLNASFRLAEVKWKPK
jgi:hypothetical protein